MARVTWKARWALRRLRRKGSADKLLAIFDTYGPLPADPGKLEEDKKWFYPGAAGRMQKLAEKLGLNVFAKTLRCLVQGAKGPLQEGELGKAAQFAGEFVAAIDKKQGPGDRAQGEEKGTGDRGQGTGKKRDWMKSADGLGLTVYGKKKIKDGAGARHKGLKRSLRDS